MLKRTVEQVLQEPRFLCGYDFGDTWVAEAGQYLATAPGFWLIRRS